MIVRNAVAEWMGNLKDGGGQISTGSAALQERPYGFGTRFGDLAGTNPEELLGAAHAACFAMQLSSTMSDMGAIPEELTVSADVSVGPDESGGFRIIGVHLDVTGRVAELSQDTFREFVSRAAGACPVSRALSVPVEIDVHLS